MRRPEGGLRGLARWTSACRTTAASRPDYAFALHLGLTTAAADKVGHHLAALQPRDKTRGADYSAGGEPTNKKSGRGPPTKATPSAQDPARRPEKNAAGASEANYSRAKMLGPSGEFVELRVSGVRRLQRALLPSRRRPAASGDAPRRRPTVGSPRTPAPHTGTSCRSTSCGRD